MPPRPPPSPPVLTVLSTFAGLVAGWLAVAITEVGRAGSGLLAGVALRRLEFTPPWYFVRAVQDGTPASPGGWLLLTFGGAILLLLLAFPLAGLISILRSKGWLRSGALSLLLVALAWIPTMLVAGALRRGERGGPVGVLYQALGDPQAGRWAALGLGLLALWLAGGVAARRTAATGRAWMRADAVMFRRRLVRVVAGYPLGIAMAVVAALLGWMATVAAVAWAAVILIVVVIRTS